MVEFSIYDFFNHLNTLKVRIRMDAGQVDIPPDPELLSVLREKIAELNYSSYSGISELREKIAEIHGVEVEETIVVPGSKYAIAALVNASKKIGLISPYWPGYKYAVEIFNKEHATIETSVEGEWMPNFNLIDESVDLMIINYPNNPTGAVLTKDKIKELLDTALEKRFSIVSDEVYRDLVFESVEFSLTEYIVDSVVSVYSFSKTFSMPGLRLGYAVGDRSLIKRIGEFIKATYTSTPIFAQKTAIKALELKDKIAERLKRVYRERINLFSSLIDRELFDFTLPRGGLYVFLKIKSNIPGLKLAYKLAERGVGVFPGLAFGSFYKNYIRISLTCPTPLLQEGVEILNETVREWRE